MEWQTLLIIVNNLLWRVQILSPRSGPVHPSLGWWNYHTSEGWGQAFKVQPVSLHFWGVGPFPHPWEESKPKVVLARKAEVAPPNGIFHRPNHNPTIQGRILHFCMDREFPQALVPWLFLPDIPPPGSPSGANLSQMTDRHVTTFLLNAFWCGYSLSAFIQALQRPCKDGQCLIWHKICQCKINPSKMLYYLWTSRANLYWMSA